MLLDMFHVVFEPQITDDHIIQMQPRVTESGLAACYVSRRNNPIKSVQLTTSLLGHLV